MWFTNHARDWINDDMPNDTLHRVTMHAWTMAIRSAIRAIFSIPNLAKAARARNLDVAAAKLGPHIAPLGCVLHGQRCSCGIPQQYVYCHARLMEPVGTAITSLRVIVDANGNTKMQPFLEGFPTDEKADPPMRGPGRLM